VDRDPYPRILPLTNGSGPNPDSDPDPALFVTDLQDANKKLIFIKKVFLLLLFEGTFTLFFKDKKPKRGHRTVKIKVFLTIFA
jgi:hypothetical protein